MRKMSKKITCAILAATMLATAFTGCGKSSKLDGTQIVLTVDEHEVTLGMAHLILRENQASSEDYIDLMVQYYGGTANDYKIWDDIVEDGNITYGEQQKENVMGTLCELYAIKNHMEDYDIVLTEEDNKKIEAAAEQFMKDNTQETIDALGVSKSDIVTYLELATIRGRMQGPMLADVDREVSDEEANQTTVTYASISILGSEKDEDGKTISLTDEQKAAKKALLEELIAAIKEEKDIAKADISALAKEISADITVTTSTYTTHDAENQYAVNEVVWKAAEDLKDGELCEEVLKASSSYYIVRMDAVTDEEATEEKREEIIAERETEEYEKIVEGWVGETKVDLNHEVWAQVELTNRQSFRYLVDDSEEE